MSKNEIGVGLLGFGTVGAGVVECLQQNGDVVAERTGTKLVLRKIADLDLERDRGVAVDRALLTRDAESVVDDPAVDIVVELIGGTGAARDLILRAIGKKKPVVTANKALLAEFGGEIFGAAREQGVDVGFEAAVCGGIPIIRALREGLVANRVISMFGILNGTCNYILTRMSKEHMAFETVLQEAQKAGYAEADPGLDVDGHDTAHKALILASLAYGFRVPPSAIRVEGIRQLACADIEYANDLGYCIKLLAIIKDIGGRIDMKVAPCLIQRDHMLASVVGVFNAVLVKGDIAGETLYYGKGAGRRPTASAVVSDLADIGRKMLAGSRVSLEIGADRDGKLLDSGKSVVRYYLRMSLLDKPGTFGKVATVLGAHGVSIASVLQKETQADEHVPVIVITHSASEEQFRTALSEIDAMGGVGAETVRLRIEDFE